jgi:hypothetical protein
LNQAPKGRNIKHMVTPCAQFRKIGSVIKNQDVFVYETIGDWIRISTDQQWVSRKLVTFAV